MHRLPTLRGWLLPALVYAADVAVQTAKLGKVIYPASDEGVYLQAARLLTEGLLPYRDFYLSHPPYAIAGAAVGLLVVGFRMAAFQALYTLWVFSAVFPLFGVVRSRTGSRWAALAAVLLFSTFPELAMWDGRFFSLRAATLPLLAWALWSLETDEHPVRAGLLLGLYGAALVPNLALSLLLVGTLALGALLDGQGLKAFVRERRGFLLAFSASLGLLVGAVFLLPGAIDCLVRFQLVRPSLPLAARLGALTATVLPRSGLLLLLGLAGSLWRPSIKDPFALTNVVGTAFVLFGARSFYPHYLGAMAVPLSISAGTLLARVPAGRIGRSAVGVLLLAAGSWTAGRPLLDAWSSESPGLLRVVDEVREAPGPLFTCEPIYALWAGRELTDHRFSADMRNSRVLREKLDAAALQGVLDRSGSVLVEPSLAFLATPSLRDAIDRDFVTVWSDRFHRLLVRRERGSGPLGDRPGRRPAQGPSER